MWLQSFLINDGAARVTSNIHSFHSGNSQLSTVNGSSSGRKPRAQSCVRYRIASTAPLTTACTVRQPSMSTKQASRTCMQACIGTKGTSINSSISLRTAVTRLCPTPTHPMPAKPSSRKTLGNRQNILLTAVLPHNGRIPCWLSQQPTYSTTQLGRWEGWGWCCKHNMLPA